MKKILLLFILLAVGLGMQGQGPTPQQRRGADRQLPRTASGVEVGGIYYELDAGAKTATVISGYQAGITQTPYSGVLKVPSTIVSGGDTYTVTAVKGSAFEYATCTEVYLPQTCTTLGTYTFDSMEALKVLDLGGVTQLPNWAINNCANLRDLYLRHEGEKVTFSSGVCIASSIRENLNVHVPPALLADYVAFSFWKTCAAVIQTNDVEVDGLYYRCDAATKTAMLLAPYKIKGNGKPKKIGPAVEVLAKLTVDGVDYAVEELEGEIFYLTPNVTSIKFNEGLKTINFETFYNTNVSELEFPNSLETLDRGNFYGCKTLKKITFGTGIKKLGSSLCNNSTALTEITVKAATPPAAMSGTIFHANFTKSNVKLRIPKGSLAAYQADSNWSGFGTYEEVDFGGSNPGDDDGAQFIEADGVYYELNRTDLSASVVSGYQAGITQTPYAGVVNVAASVEHGGKTFAVKSVKGQAFQYATATEVHLPQSCTTLGAYAFDTCDSLRLLDLGGVNDLPGHAIEACPNLKDLYLGCESGVVGNITASIPSTLRENLNIHVPAGMVSNYRSNSFWTACRAILTPNEVQVGDLYYNYDTAKKTAYVRAPYVIYGNGQPKQIGPAVDVPGAITVDGTEYTVTNLEAGVFYQTPNVTSVTFHEGLKNIEYETFWQTKVTDIVFPNTLENLSYSNFYKCTTLKTLTFGTGIKTIGNNTLNGCTAMTDLTVLAEVPPTLEAGRSGSIFASTCPKSQITLHIPAGTKAAYQADANWQGFKEYKEIGVVEPVEEGRVYVDGVWYYITKTAYNGQADVFKCSVVSPVESGDPTGEEYKGVVNIPDTLLYNNRRYIVTEIGTQAFYMQTGMTGVRIPATVTGVSMQAFQESGITEITLPEALTTVENNAFRRCTALKTLTARGLTPATATATSFATITTTCKLLVPRGKVDAYKAATGWKDFTTIEEDPNAPVLPTSVAIRNLPGLMLVGDTVTLTALITPADATDQSVQWKSLKPEVATVTADGLMTAVGIGNAQIEVICNGNRTVSAIATTACIDSTATIGGLRYRFELGDNGKKAFAYVTRPESGSYTGDITVPEQVQHHIGFRVRGIDASAFEGMTAVTGMKLPAAMDTIGPRAFAGTGIDILVLPDSLRNVPADMAANCPELVSVGLPDHLKTIGKGAFAGSTAIRYIRCVNYGVDNSLVPPQLLDPDNTFATDIWPDCMLVIPSSMYSNFKKQEGWKKFRTWAYWHDTDVEPTSAAFPAELIFKSGQTHFRTPTTTPENALILNLKYTVKTTDPTVATFETKKTGTERPELAINTLKEGETQVTVYMNLVKATFKLKVDNTIGVDGIDAEAGEVRYFDLNGFEVKTPAPGQVYIRIRGTKAERVLMTN